jgi:ribosomal protein S18 acetylase RimI-like enzyme
MRCLNLASYRGYRFAMHVQRLGHDDAERFLLFRAQGLATDPDAFRVTREDDVALPIDAWRSRLVRDYVVTVEGRSGEWLSVGGLSQFDGEKLHHKGLVWGMYVAPAARGTGAADEIMKSLVGNAKGRMRHLQLTVMADNLRARAFYERHKFTTYAVEAASVLRPDGYADEALMWRMLD